MKDLRWIYAGASVGLAGVIALAIAAAPSGEPVGTASTSDAISPVAAAPTSVAPVPPPASRTVVAPAPQAPAPVASSGIVPGSAGMVIAIDPETGEVGMPTPEQLADLKLNENEAVMKDDAGLVQVRHADGHWSMDLQGRFQEYAVIRKAADGTTTIGCVDHPANADHVHPAPAGLEEE